MREVVRHVVWSTIVLGVALFALILTVQIGVKARTLNYAPIAVRDEVYPGVHHLSGNILVPKTCDELIVHTEQVTSRGYRIVFETWENPAIACYKTPMLREFHAVAFAPSNGVSFTATLDGKPVSVGVVQDIRQK